MTDEFYPEARPVPTGLVGDGFVLEVLRPEVVELDYEALMDSKEHLRMWSRTTWPDDDFTVADNMKDMEMHHGEYVNREAFAFTILSPDKTRCIGCVYIESTRWLNKRGVDADLPGDLAVVDYWVRADELAGDLDYRLRDAFLTWLDEEWEFADVCFGSRTENTRHVDLLADRLEHARTIRLERDGEPWGTFELFRVA